MSHADELRDLAAWMTANHPERGNAPLRLEEAAAALTQAAVTLRATVAVLRTRGDETRGPWPAAFLYARADDLEAVAELLDTHEEVPS